MTDREQILKNLYAGWETLEETNFPPSEEKILLTDGECIVYIEDAWGPAIPYPNVDHGNGELNYGYRRIKGDLDTVNSIPEVSDYPEYRDFLKAVNSEETAIESVGCEKSFFPITDHLLIKMHLGSYTDIIFSDPALNGNPKNILYLASVFVQSLNGSSAWWSKAELGIQRLKKLNGCPKPWGLMLKVHGYGRTSEEARACWAISLNKLAESVANIEINEIKSL